MEELLKVAITQVPALAVLAVVVMVFLKHIRASDADNLEARNHSRGVIEKNSEVVGRNTVACEEMTRTMREFLISKK